MALSAEAATACGSNGPTAISPQCINELCNDTANRSSLDGQYRAAAVLKSPSQGSHLFRLGRATVSVSHWKAAVVDRTPNDDDPVAILPSAERVAARALVLSAIVCRAAIEGDAGNTTAEAFRADVLSWIRDLGLVEEVESNEVALLECKLGGLSDRDRIDASWRAEGLAVLAWALRRCELPVYDKRADPYPIALALGFREIRRDSILENPGLRLTGEVSNLADVLFTLQWRMRQFSVDRKPMNFGEFAKTARFGPLSLMGLRLVSDDLEIRGVPVCDASEEDWREVLSIARERQQAANWLLGQESVYSQVTCDT
jgi:hypothetical protein